MVQLWEVEHHRMDRPHPGERGNRIHIGFRCLCHQSVGDAFNGSRDAETLSGKLSDHPRLL
jgi:hypothetical protein